MISEEMSRVDCRGQAGGRDRMKVETDRASRSRSRERDHERDRHWGHVKVEPGRASRSRSRERDHGRYRHRKDTIPPPKTEPISDRPSKNPSINRKSWIDTARALMRRVHPAFLTKQVVAWEVKNNMCGTSMAPPTAFHDLSATFARVASASALPPSASPSAVLNGHVSDGVRTWGGSWVKEQLWIIVVVNVNREDDDDDDCPWAAWLHGPPHGGPEPATRQ